MPSDHATLALPFGEVERMTGRLAELMLRLLPEVTFTLGVTAIAVTLTLAARSAEHVPAVLVPLVLVFPAVAVTPPVLVVPPVLDEPPVDCVPAELFDPPVAFVPAAAPDRLSALRRPTTCRSLP